MLRGTINKNTMAIEFNFNYLEGYFWLDLGIGFIEQIITNSRMFYIYLYWFVRYILDFKNNEGYIWSYQI